MGVEKRVKTTSKPKKPPASSIIVSRLKLLLTIDRMTLIVQLTQPIDSKRVKLTILLVVTTWALLQSVTSANRKYDDKFDLSFT